MLRLLVLIIIISGVKTRGVPTADDNAKLGLKGIETDKKDHSSEHATLTACRGCQKGTDKANGKDEDLPERNDIENEIGKDAVNRLLTTPKARGGRIVKPSLTFHRINVHVNRDRRKNRRISHNRGNNAKRYESDVNNSKHTGGYLSRINIDVSNNAYRKGSKAANDFSKELKESTTNSQNKSNRKERKEARKHDQKEEDDNKAKAQRTKGKDRDTDLKDNGDSDNNANNEGSTKLGSQRNADVKITENDYEKMSGVNKEVVGEKDRPKKPNSNNVKNEKIPKHIPKTNEKLARKKMNGSKLVKDNSEISTVEQREINSDRGYSLKLTGETKGTKSNSGKTPKDTDSDFEKIDQDFINKNTKYTSKVLNESRSDLGKTSKRSKNGRKDKINKKTNKSDIEKDNIKISKVISTEKPNDEKNAKDVMSGRKLKDRWSRKGLSQVPDVERLERRLHPTLDAPVNDIIGSMKNMLRLIQSSLAKVEKDFAMVQNTTRWTYMLGVRNHLSELADKNDEVFDVVMETSLLTKEIYRKAHEHKHPRSDIEAVAVAYRSRLNNNNMHPKMLENFNAAQTELDMSKKLVYQINSIQAQKDLLFDEEMRVHQLVRDRLPLRTMHDLYRRADQTIRVLTAAQPLSRYGDKNMLYMHMRNDSDLNMRRAKELIVEGFDLLSHAKRVLLGNRRKVQEHSRLMRQRVPVDIMSDMTFDSGRMELYVASDVASHHANGLAETAAEIHMKFVPLMKKAKEVIANNSGYELKKRLDHSVNEMRTVVKKLVNTLDKIRLAIRVEEIIKDRCEAILASDRFSFDEDSPLDCDPYVKVDGSGNGIDGSGETDDSFVDMEIIGTNVTKEVTHINASSDESFIDIDDPTPTNTIVDIDITKPEESSLNIEKTTNNIHIDDLSNLTNTENKGDQMSKHSTKDPKNSTIIDRTTKKQNNVQAVTKTTPVGYSLDSDDEDIAQELKLKLTKKTPTPTSTTPTTTTSEKPTTTDDSGLFFDFFSWGNDDPRETSVVIDAEYDDTMLSAVVLNMTFNEHIRKRLYNYSQDSKMLLDEAQKNKSKIDEMILTWQKVKQRFGQLENKTQSAKSLIVEWKASNSYFNAVHNRVDDLTKDIQLKKEVIETQCSDAVEVANKKLRNMEKVYKKKANKAEKAADPTDVKEAVTKVQVVLDNVKEINRLKQLYPSPCHTLEKLDRKIRANITELRQKIERAKLIASTLQVAVELPKKEYLEFPITELDRESHPLTSNVQMMLKHSGSDGRLMSLQVGDSESLSLDVESDTLKVVQNIDGDETSQTLYDEQIQDKWYLVQLQRFAAGYNFTMFGENGLLRKLGFPSSSADQRPYTPDLLPTTVRLGATGDDLSACTLGFEINGRRINMFDMAENKSLLTPCSSQVRGTDQQLLLDGSGYAVVRISDIVSLRLLQSIKIAFNPRSDGIVIYLQPERMSTIVDIYVENGFLIVFVHYHDFETKLKSTVQVYSQNHILEIKFTRGRTKQANVILNGVSNIFKTAKGGKRKHKDDYENIFIGGFREDNSSMVGCVKSLEVNGDVIPFHNIYEAEGHGYGSCPQTECVMFDKDSIPIETNYSTVNMMHVSIARNSLGPVLKLTKLSKKKEKFNLEISLDKDGVHVEETVKDNSEDFSVEEDTEYITIAIKDDSKSKSLMVTVGDDSEEFEYGEGAWWGGKKKTDDGPVSYSVSIATASDTSPAFLGRVQNLIIDGRPVGLLKYVDSNNLGRCTVNPSARIRGDKHTSSAVITCQ